MKRFDAFGAGAGLNDTTASPYVLALALALSWDRDPEALRYFKRVGPDDLHDYALEWQTRAAIWSGDWPLVANTVAAMSDTQRGLTRWRDSGGARRRTQRRSETRAPVEPYSRPCWTTTTIRSRRLRDSDSRSRRIPSGW